MCRRRQVLAAEDTPGWEAYQQRIFEAWSGLNGVLEPPKPHWRALRCMLPRANWGWSSLGSLQAAVRYAGRGMAPNQGSLLEVTVRSMEKQFRLKSQPFTI